jgi:hypothetical protein
MNREKALSLIKDKIPKSHSELIVVRHSEMGIGFKIRDSYVAEYLKNFIEPERFHGFVNFLKINHF